MEGLTLQEALSDYLVHDQATSCGTVRCS
jgi:hypothetical protein